MSHIQCPLDSNEILDDVLETESLLNWHNTPTAEQDIAFLHSHLNYHAVAIEKIEHYLRNAVTILSQSPDYFKR